MKVSGTTRVFALLGRPVAHSLSPRMHNAAFTAMGLDAVYAALDCGAEAVPALIAALTSAGGGGNITVPHKAVAAAAVAGIPGALDGACNTFWGEEGRAVGTSTDVEGILGGIDALGATGVASWLIVGTGGSAIAAAAAAARCGVRVAVRSRSADRAREFLARAGALGASGADPAECAVVLNATPLGLAEGDPLPVRPSEAPAAGFALDLVYRRGETVWVAAMRAAGARAVDGREVLVRQGAASFERWFPGRQAPLDIMRAAVRDGLG
jgi:shikimate dehydrogenase